MSDVVDFIEEDDSEDLEEDLDTGKASDFIGKSKYTNADLEEWADRLLREDSNRELCPQCVEANKGSGEPDPEFLPYGEETGNVEWKPQYKKDGTPIEDDEGNLLYVAYPEMQCEQGHRWYFSEGIRRALDGPNPILFESHLYNRKRRELLATDGVVDPAYTMDRWGKRPTTGMYYRSHPQGRKTNTPEQRQQHGAGFYKRSLGKMRFPYRSDLVMSDDHCVLQVR